MTKPESFIAPPGRAQTSDDIRQEYPLSRSADLALPPAGKFAAWGTVGIFALLALSSGALLLEDRIGGSFGAALPALFFVDNEQNVSTAAAFGLITVGWLLITVTALRQRAARARWRRYWFGLSAIFLYLAYDEAARVHERLNGPMQNLFDASGALTFAWVIPAIVFVTMIGAIYLRFVFALPPIVRALVCTSAVVFLSGAIGIEMIGAYIADNPKLWDAYQKVARSKRLWNYSG